MALTKGDVAWRDGDRGQRDGDLQGRGTAGSSQPGRTAGRSSPCLHGTLPVGRERQDPVG